jgi:MFS family permease
MPSHDRRVLITLTLAQALYLCAVSVDLTVTSLAGYTLAPAKWLATVPLALIAVGSVIVAPAVSRLIAWWGPRRVFMLGVLASLTGGTLSAVGVSERVFPLLCSGTMLVGVYQAIAGYYRYCAADLGRGGRDVTNLSTVLAGGVAAAVIGPYLASWAAGWFGAMYSGSYVLVAVLACLALAVVATLRLEPPGRAGAAAVTAPGEAGPVPRPLRTIVSQPVFITGAAGTFVGYFVMAVAMGGAPLAMRMTGAAGMMAGASSQTAFVIQLHIAGMYAPMLIIPVAVKRYGVWSVLAAGTTLSVLGTLADISGTTLGQFGAGLLLIGVGWSLMYASGSILLSRSYTACERRSVRGYGELAPVAGMMFGSVLAAPLITGLGWQPANVLCVALLVIPAAFTWLYRSAVIVLDRG